MEIWELSLVRQDLIQLCEKIQDRASDEDEDPEQVLRDFSAGIAALKIRAIRDKAEKEREESE